jgi:hypothetical protein
LMYSYYNVEYLGQLLFISYQLVWIEERHSVHSEFRLDSGEGFELSLLSFCLHLYYK